LISNVRIGRRIKHCEKNVVVDLAARVFHFGSHFFFSSGIFVAAAAEKYK
jgi:hypothetical protein